MRGRSRFPMALMALCGAAIGIALLASVAASAECKGIGCIGVKLIWGIDLSPIEKFHDDSPPIGKPARGPSTPAEQARAVDTGLACVTSRGAFDLLMLPGSNVPHPGEPCAFTYGNEKLRGWLVLTEPSSALWGSECATPFGKLQVTPALAGTLCVVDGRMRGWIMLRSSRQKPLKCSPAAAMRLTPSPRYYADQPTGTNRRA
jgi:hypothetical protein